MLMITAAWGSCFVAIDWGLRDAPVLWFAAFRSLIAGALLVAMASVQHRPHPRGIAAWSQISVLALFNVTIAFAAMFAAAAALSAGVGSVLSNAQPLLILLPAWWLFGERPRRELVGIALVLAGQAGGLAWPARDQRKNNDRLSPGQAGNALDHAASVKFPHEHVDIWSGP